MNAKQAIATGLAGAAVLAALGLVAGEIGAFGGGYFDASGRQGFNCSACHSGAAGSAIQYALTPVNPADPPIETGYVPGSTYDVDVSVTGGPGQGWGFAFDADGGAGILTDPVNTKLNTDPNFPSNFTHTTTGHHQSSWSFQWTAPGDIKTIRFWGSGNSVNGNGTPSGDAPTSTVTLAADPAVGDEILCRRGNVNEAAGQQQDVVLVNGSPGTGAERRVTMTQSDPFTLTVETPNSNPGGPAPFVLYFYLGAPDASTVRTLPKQVGLFCMPSPLTDQTIPSLKKITNNIGFENKLGQSSFPSDPAPSTVLDKPNGLGRTGTIFIQGIILDEFAPNARAAVTNGVELALLP